MEKLISDLKNFENKVKWRWILGKSRIQQYMIQFVSTRSPTQPVDPALGAWLSRFRVHVVDAVKRVRSRHIRDRSFSNVYPVVRVARSLLQSMKLVGVPNDKEPGFTVLTNG